MDGVGKKVVVLGCTGSIGDTCFKVLENLGAGFDVMGLSGGVKIPKLIDRAHRWRPAKICVAEEEAVSQVRSALPGSEVVWGNAGLQELVTMPGVELVLNGLVGAIGLQPTLAALAEGKTVAMANKEPLVMAGGLILEAARTGGGTVLPLDSEPNAIWQCLKGEDSKELRRIILTASGGPFCGSTRGEMRDISPAEALDHPTWKMGPKITVDCATLINKGFEVIEATWLFDVGIDQVDVVVHRQSIVHSLVEFCDGAILAHMGKTDMFLPIQYALTHPGRHTVPIEPLDLAALGQLTFAEPDWENFPCLDLCYGAGRCGGTAPAALNAANEEAVGAFLGGRIAFGDIADVNGAVMADWPEGDAEDVAAVLAADRVARQRAGECIARLGR